MSSNPMTARPVRFAAVAAAVLLTATACGGRASTSAAEKQVEARAVSSFAANGPAGATVVPIVVKDDSVSPTGTSLRAGLDKPVLLQITATQAGELHVHSSPEQHVEFPVGTSQVTLRFDQPGVIDIEDHKLDKLIVQLEVR